MHINSFSFSLVVIFSLLSFSLIHAQGIGINETGAAPDPSAILDASSTEKGFLLPRMTTSQRNGISSPAQGLHIFNLDTDCIEVFFNQGGWLPVRCGCPSFPDATFNFPALGANVPATFEANTIVGTNNYQWTFTGASPPVSSNTIENVTWSSAGTYTVSLTVTDENSCSSTQSETVTVVPCLSFPDATFTGNNGSINSPIAFSANGSGPGYTYAWTFPSGTPSTSSLQNPNVEWSTAGTYTVELTVTDNLGCSATETMAVTISLCTPDGPWNFTNCGNIGHAGPNQTQCNASYSSTNLNGLVVISAGIQQWTIPSTGTYRIIAAGAAGGTDIGSGGDGGDGAVISGEFALNAGDVLTILVGQKGYDETATTNSTGGGGGSFVVFSGQPLIVAGGGGGGTLNDTGTLGQVDWSRGNGATSTTGKSGEMASTIILGGVNGNAGQEGPGSSLFRSSGYIENGTGGSLSFINGGLGGDNGRFGGFGGGASVGTANFGRTGGGGGYSGGATTGGANNNLSSVGGGGGSFISSSAQNPGTSDGNWQITGSEPHTAYNGPVSNLSIWNANQGYVTIEKICP